ncbi:hypothetical protein [Geopseudomonas aromaticivorans]
MTLRSDYWSGRIGTNPAANSAFLAEMREWLTGLGTTLVARGAAESFEIRERLPGLAAEAAGQIVLYAVSAKVQGVGATLVVIQSNDENPYLPRRMDGVRVHAQAREIRGGHWKSDNVTANPIHLASLEDPAVLDVLEGILEGAILAPQKNESV